LIPNELGEAALYPWKARIFHAGSLLMPTLRRRGDDFGRIHPAKPRRFPFGEKILNVLDQGKFTSTYESGVLLSFVHLCLESAKVGGARRSSTCRKTRFSEARTGFTAVRFGQKEEGG